MEFQQSESIIVDLENLPSKPGNWHIVWNYRNGYSEIGEWYCANTCHSRKSVTSWKNGKPSGRWISWYKDEQLKSYVEYKNGKVDGIKKEWSNQDYKLIIDQIWEDGKLIKDNLKEKNLT